MQCVIVCKGVAGTVLDNSGSPAGKFLASYTPEANEGLGAVQWTDDPAGAMVFDGFKAAFECWRSVPRNRPLRPDGKPNRPLTAFTVEFRDPQGRGSGAA